jgi:hypothetical protein
MADSAALIAAFDKSLDSGDVLTLSVSNLRGLSSEAVNAGGRVMVNLATSVVTSTVTGLPSAGSFDLWLVDNRPSPGHTTFAETGDVSVRVGTYSPSAGAHSLSATLGSAVFATFFPDRAFVVRTGQISPNPFVLTGPSTLFDRLRRRQVHFADDPQGTIGFDPTATSTRGANFAKLVAAGRQLFLNEKFNGNGRSCGTCHVETNNFTIDPNFIAALPRTDPLFVAETNPLLANLEKPDLMRRFGLILVNADGFDPSRGFVLRSVQNVQALLNSTTPQDPSYFIDFSTNGRNPNPPERLGWGNDGAPLRDLALVAIGQHATKTLNRRRGIDFRVPTDEELDAMAAYQLSLGRQEDFTLTTLELKSTLATRSKALYLDSGNLFEPGHKNCNGCHFNAGGTAGMSFNSATPGFPKIDGSPAGFNIGASTNVNETPLALSLGLPRDGGFGQIPTIFGSFGNTDDLPPPFGHLELEEFNSPPLVESADTGPFFHNHTVATLEGAVAFYGTTAFKNSVFARAVPIDISGDAYDSEVQAIAAFLRNLNALENIRSSMNIAGRGRQMAGDDDARELAGLALAETVDAIKVLSDGALAKSLEPSILTARANLLAAQISLDVARHLPIRPLVNLAIDQALGSLRAARAALANTATLPPSYRN